MIKSFSFRNVSCKIRRSIYNSDKCYNVYDRNMQIHPMYQWPPSETIQVQEIFSLTF